VDGDFAEGEARRLRREQVELNLAREADFLLEAHAFEGVDVKPGVVRAVTIWLESTPRRLMSSEE